MPSYLPFTVCTDTATVPHFCSIFIFLADWASADQLENGEHSGDIFSSPMSYFFHLLSKQLLHVKSNFCRNTKFSCWGGAHIAMAQWEHGEMKPAPNVQERKFHCRIQDMSSTHTVDTSNFSVMFSFATSRPVLQSCLFISTIASRQEGILKVFTWYFQHGQKNSFSVFCLWND